MYIIYTSTRFVVFRDVLLADGPAARSKDVRGVYIYSPPALLGIPMLGNSRHPHQNLFANMRLFIEPYLMTEEEIAIDILTEFYKKYGIAYKVHAHISLQLPRYFNFRLKFIQFPPRTILISRELSQKLHRHPHQDALFDIIQRTGKGADINPYQSKESFNVDYHDRLFNDWGIHHLHLSTTKKKPTDYFHTRTGPLLFARFTNTTAYFLDVKGHQDKNVWSDRELIRIIVRNWPESIAHAKHPNIFYPDLDDAQIGKLRRQGHMFGVNIDGTGYLLLGHGQASSGDNMMAGRMANKVWYWIGQQLDLLAADPAAFREELKRKLGL